MESIYRLCPGERPAVALCTECKAPAERCMSAECQCKGIHQRCYRTSNIEITRLTTHPKQITCLGNLSNLIQRVSTRTDRIFKNCNYTFWLKTVGCNSEQIQAIKKIQNTKIKIAGNQLSSLSFKPSEKELTQLDQCLVSNYTNIQEIIDCLERAFAQLLQIRVDKILSASNITGSPAAFNALNGNLNKLKYQSEKQKRRLKEKLESQKNSISSFQKQLRNLKKAGKFTCSSCQSAQTQKINMILSNMKLSEKLQILQTQLKQKTMECDFKDQLLKEKSKQIKFFASQIKEKKPQTGRPSEKQQIRAHSVDKRRNSNRNGQTQPLKNRYIPLKRPSPNHYQSNKIIKTQPDDPNTGPIFYYEKWIGKIPRVNCQTSKQIDEKQFTQPNFYKAPINEKKQPNPQVSTKRFLRRKQ